MLNLTPFELKLQHKLKYNAESVLYRVDVLLSTISKYSQSTLSPSNKFSCNLLRSKQSVLAFMSWKATSPIFPISKALYQKGLFCHTSTYSSTILYCLAAGKNSKQNRWWSHSVAS